MQADTTAPSAVLRWQHLVAIARRAAEAPTPGERFKELRVLEQQLRGEEGELADTARELLSIGLRLTGLLTKSQARAHCFGMIAFLDTGLAAARTGRL